MSHIPQQGYEDAAFFGRNCHSCLRPEEVTPYEAAFKYAAKVEGSYVIEEEDGWTVYVPRAIEELPPKVKAALDGWLSEPIKEKIARWKREMVDGRRDQDGRWIGKPRH